MNLYQEGVKIPIDNDPLHKSKIMQRYLEQNFMNVIDWPSYSPELNPVAGPRPLIRPRVPP